MTSTEWIADVIDAASALGYRVDEISWRESTVRLAPAHDPDGDSITIRSLFLSSTYLLAHLRPCVARASIPSEAPT